MTLAEPAARPRPAPPGGPAVGPPARRSVHRRPVPVTALPVLLAIFPLVVPALAIVARRPHITWSDDRALTELAVREAARGRQLLGIGGRFGWRHPGPLWIYMLVPLYELTGRTTWSLTIGAMALHVAAVAIAVAAAGRAGGLRAASVVAALVVVYTASTGMIFWTNLWAGYAFTWPLVALIVVVALAAGDPRAGWALPAAVLFGTLLVQTDVSTIVPVVVVLAGGSALRWGRYGTHRLVQGSRGRHAVSAPPAGTGRRAHAPGRRGWEPVSPSAAMLLAVVVCAWIPPLVEEATGHPGNLTLLVQFVMKGAGGYSLHTAMAAVGAALSVVPFGARWVLSDRLADHLRPGPTWAVLLTLGYLALLAAAAVVGWRRGRRVAGDLAGMTLLAIVAAILAMSRVDGSINFYLVTWVTALPITGLASVVLAFAPDSRAGGWRIRVAGGHADPVTWVGAGVAAVVALWLVFSQGTVHNWDRVGSAEVATQTQLVSGYLGPAAQRLVRVHILTSATWRPAAGVADQLERRGARIEVDNQWVFLFGDGFAPTRAAPSGEVWFAAASEVPLVAGQPGITELGSVSGVHVFARIDRRS